MRALLLLLLVPLAHAADTLPIPEGTTSVHFNGKKLRIAPFEDLAAFVAPRLYIPRGRHLVRWNGAESLVKISRKHFATAYRKQRADLRAGSDGGRAKLVELLARGFGFPDTATAPHLLGNWHWIKGDKDAAKRWWNRSVLQNPAFAPSHVNLAMAALEAGDKGVGSRELLLARAFNLGDGFGVAAAIAGLAVKHELELTGGTTLRAKYYQLGELEELTETDARMARFYRGIGVHFPRREGRAKLMSNLGLYFTSKGKPARAREAYRQSLAELVRAGRSAEGYGIAAVVFSNMAKACKQSGWKGEADDFTAMAAAAKKLR